MKTADHIKRLERYRRYRERNREDINKRGNEWYGRHKEQCKARRIAKRKGKKEYDKQHGSKNAIKISVQRAGYRMENRGKILMKKKGVNGRLSTYKNMAKRREHSFDLTKEQFCAFWQVPCAYCGGEIETVGIDRIDSSKGYTVNNVVSCCRICNIMKWDRSREELLQQCRRILVHAGVMV